MCTGVELIVVDGGSTDGTMRIVIENSDIVDKYITESDSGIYDAWNKGIELADATFVSFIGSDDVLAPGSLEALVGAIVGSAADLVAGFNILTKDRVPVAVIRSLERIEQMNFAMPVAHVMSAHRLSWLKSVGGFNVSYRSAGDYELMLRTARVIRYFRINSVLAFMEDGGISSRGILPIKEKYRAQRSNGVPRSTAVLSALRALIKIFISGLHRG